MGTSQSLKAVKTVRTEGVHCWSEVTKSSQDIEAEWVRQWVPCLGRGMIPIHGDYRSPNKWVQNLWYGEKCLPTQKVNPRIACDKLAAISSVILDDVQISIRFLLLIQLRVAGGGAYSSSHRVRGGTPWTGCFPVAGSTKTDRQPFAHRCAVNLTPLSGCLWITGESQSTWREHENSAQTPEKLLDETMVDSNPGLSCCVGQTPCCPGCT